MLKDIIFWKNFINEFVIRYNNIPICRKIVKLYKKCIVIIFTVKTR